MDYPLVTVFTLIYNTNPKFVIEAIESIRDNNYPNIQHIIIDDCSPNPEPKQIIKKWVEENKYPCEFYEHESNYGICKTLNHALELAKGKYFCGCSDDILLPNKIFKETEVLENLPIDYAATYSDAYLIDENGQPLNGRFIQNYRQFDKLPDGELYTHLLEGNFLPAMAMMIRTDFIRAIGGYDESLKFEDFDVWLRLFRKYKIKLINEPLSKYRIHGDSLTHKLSNLEWEFDYLNIYRKHSENTIAKNKINLITRSLISKTKSYKKLRMFGFKFPFFWFITSSILPSGILDLIIRAIQKIKIQP